MEIKTYKCPCCSAPLGFDSSSQNLACKSCENTYTIEQIEELESLNDTTNDSEFNWETPNYEELDPNEINMTVFSCPSCGAEIVGDSSMAATECLYCGNPVVVSKQLSGIYKPDYIIPFKFDKNAAKNALSNFYKGKKLLPNLFKEENRIEKISGVYVPFWLFDCDADTKITYDASRTHVWSDSKYSYTKTDHYKILREGILSFDKIPVDGSKKMADNYMDALEPFDYSDITPFNSGFLAGYFADRYDMDAQSSMPRANERVTNSTVETFRNTVNGYSSVLEKSSNINVKSGNIKYALFPVWMLNTKYNDNMYTFAMNGQTGKLIGELPVDRAKYWKWFAGVAASSVVLSQIILLICKAVMM